MIRAIAFGLGPIGSEIARVAASRSGIEVVGAVDIDPEKVGRTLYDVAGAESDVRVVDSLDRALVGVSADVLIHSTSSSLREVQPQLEAALKHGLSVVSTCEELAYPWRTQEGIARALDEAAQANGVRMLGAGVNPGFVMDALPLVLTAACQRVDRITVERVLDAGGRRVQLQRKVGAGLTPDEFGKLVAAGTVRHVGLLESAWMVVDALGWGADELQEVIEPVMAEREMLAAVGLIQPGQVAGVSQCVRVFSRGTERLRLDLRMYVGAAEPRDRVWIAGVPDLDVVVEGGVHGDRATAAIAVNVLPALLSLPPGLRTMLDVLPARG